MYKELIGSVPIEKGSIVEVASDLLSVGFMFRQVGETFNPNKLIDVLCEAVGEDGTILIRAFNWDFCHDVPFNIMTTPSKVGSLGNTASKRKDFKRTQHPLYSWWVWGKEQSVLTGMDYKDSFEDDSIFGYFEKKKAVLLTVGNTQGPRLTLIHRAEQLAGESHRFIKNFTGAYIDTNGNETVRTYSMFVRDLKYKMIFKEYEVLEPKLQQRGLLKTGEVNGVYVKKILLPEAVEMVREDILSGESKEYLYYVPVDE
ncbi:MAG: AAC(3) family N-acetyltransferase [Tannerellaceae bacterium]|nr:AAC(3) family N-acetyltransferase [Tannerellaceae bacterium]